VTEPWLNGRASAAERLFSRTERRYVRQKMSGLSAQERPAAALRWLCSVRPDGPDGAPALLPNSPVARRGGQALARKPMPLRGAITHEKEF
jgi:hypothetical protein